MDAAAGGGIRASRRHARNQALVLLEEGSLHRMIDPGADSFYLEVLTDEVCRQAWEHFQALEQAGGMAAALRQGLPQEQTAATASKRLKALATGRASLVGVSHYAVRSEPPLLTEEPAAPPVPQGAAEKVTPVRTQRLAAAFETLRLRTWNFEQKRGRPVTVLMAPLGGSGTSRIRAQFCVTFLGAAGFRTESPAGFASVAEALEEARCLEADVLVLCAEDPEYAGLVAEFKALPGDRPLLAVAGLPAEADRLGADLFIHRDADRVGTAGDILARLEAR
jgi:methylmalonyl-CoA mutase